jgi:aminopeptidase N
MTRLVSPDWSIRRLRLVLALLCVWIVLAPREARATPGIHHDLAVRLDPASRELIAEDAITVQGGGIVEFTLARRFSVERVLVDGAPVAVFPQPAQAQRNRWRIPVGSSLHARMVVVRYRGLLEPLPPADHREVLRGLPPMADPRGSFLPGGTGWYPEIGTTPFSYRVSLDLPADQRGLVPGRLVNERSEGDRYQAAFTFAHPAEAIDLIAGPYQVREQIIRREDGDPLRFRTYFHPDLADLADDYLSALGGYVNLYSRWIGPYPYTEFSIVSSPLPTGFGMPTLTYLGADVLRLPFIRQSSLGHEILHNWWGNGVYVDFGHGNWSEGLTAFMADYAYKEREGAEAAREARLGFLRDIAAVPTGQDTPLRRFTARSHGTSQIVGYHKGAFLFIMLRDLLGETAFDAGLRSFWRDQRFRRASWADLQRAFEQASGRDLERFFDQWLSRRGAPRLRIEAVRAEQTSSGHRIRIVLTQNEPPYAVTVPVMVTTQTGRMEKRLEVTSAREEFSLEVPARPLSVIVDPDFRVLRQLEPAEVPPILRQVILDPATVTLVVAPDDVVRAQAVDLARALLDYRPTLGDPAALGAGAPLLVIGLSADVDRFLARGNLPARPERVGDRGSAQIWTAVQANGKPMAVVSAESAEALRALLRPLPHYGRQSYLIFDGGTAVERGIWPTQPPEWRFSTAE